MSQTSRSMGSSTTPALWQMSLLNRLVTPCLTFGSLFYVAVFYQYLMDAAPLALVIAVTCGLGTIGVLSAPRRLPYTLRAGSLILVMVSSGLSYLWLQHFRAPGYKRFQAGMFHPFRLFFIREDFYESQIKNGNNDHPS